MALVEEKSRCAQSRNEKFSIEIKIHPFRLRTNNLCHLSKEAIHFGSFEKNVPINIWTKVNELFCFRFKTFIGH